MYVVDYREHTDLLLHIHLCSTDSGKMVTTLNSTQTDNFVDGYTANTNSYHFQINVCGFMQRWGLTIDLVSCVALQLAVGLCVDYAAHIGHTFLTIGTGDRTQRALETVLHIGAAVFYGGGSTLLALAMLSNSDAYTFKSFFKVLNLSTGSFVFIR